MKNNASMCVCISLIFSCVSTDDESQTRNEQNNSVIEELSAMGIDAEVVEPDGPDAVCSCSGTTINTMCDYQWVTAVGNCSDLNSASSNFYVHGMFIENRSTTTNLDVGCTIPNAYLQNEYTHSQINQVVAYGVASGLSTEHIDTEVRLYTDRRTILDDFQLEDSCLLEPLSYVEALDDCTLDISTADNYWFVHATVLLPRDDSDTWPGYYAHLQGFLVCYDPD